jgi:hypothetical protein
MSAFESAFTKHTAALSAGDVVPLPKRHVTFMLDAEACLPGVFTEDMRVELRSLTAAQELRATATESMLSMAMSSARESLYSVDGIVLDPARKEWFWEAIGQAGRQVIMSQYPAVVGSVEQARGKAIASLQVGG